MRSGPGYFRAMMGRRFPLRAATLAAVLGLVSSVHSQQAPADSTAPQRATAASEIAEAEAAFERAKSEGKLTPPVILQLADAYEKGGQYGKAADLIERMVTAFVDITAQNPAAKPLLDSLRERLASLRQKAASQPKSELEEAQSLLGKAFDAAGEGRFAEGLEMFEKALPSLEKGPTDTLEFATILSNAAITYDLVRRPGKAEALHLRALELAERRVSADDRRLVSPNLFLALHYRGVGDYARCIQRAERALRIAEKSTPDAPPVAEALQALGGCHQKADELSKADAETRRAVAIKAATAGEGSSELAAYLTQLGSVLDDEGKPSEAEPLYWRALRLLEDKNGKDSTELLGILSEMGAFYEEKRDFKRSEEYFVRRRAIVERAYPDNGLTVAQALCQLGELYYVMGDRARAFPLGKRCADLREATISDILTTGSEDQKRALLAGFVKERDIFISFHTMGDPSDEEAAKLALTVVLRRKGRALDAMADSLGALRKNLGDADRILLDRLAATRADLGAIAVRGPGKGSADELRARLTRLGEEAEKLESEVSAHSARFKTEAATIDAAAVQAAIPADSALVEIVSYRPFDVKYTKQSEQYRASRYAAYVLSRSGAPRYVDLGETAPIDEAVKLLRAALASPDRKDVKDLARSLDEKVMRPVRPLLGGATKVFVSPDGALHLVPFGALVDEQGKWLVEGYAFTYLTTGRDLLRLGGSAKRTKEVLVFAAPAFDDGSSGDAENGPSASRSADLSRAKFPPLPGTADEAKAIGGVFASASVKTGQEATEGALKQAKSPTILHVATHGFFLADQAVDAPRSRGFDVDPVPPRSNGVAIENPLLRAGLALAGANQKKSGAEDGVLTALEASSLDLEGTELVVLSACETGLGEVRSGEGVYGLRRALVLAGAESTVMSLWKVDDEKTRDLMVAYYEGLKGGGGRSDALRKVQISMASKGLHPYYWAAFIPSGDPSPLDAPAEVGAAASADSSDESSSPIHPRWPEVRLGGGLGLLAFAEDPGRAWDKKNAASLQAFASIDLLGALLGREGFTVRDALVGEYIAGNVANDDSAKAMIAHYTAVVGYTGSRFGIFAGARFRYEDRTIGVVTGRGAMLPFVLRLEAPIGESGSIGIQGWALSQVGSATSKGFDVLVDFSNPVYLRGGFEITSLPAGVADKFDGTGPRTDAAMAHFSLGLSLNRLFGD